MDGNRPQHRTGKGKSDPGQSASAYGLTSGSVLEPDYVGKSAGYSIWPGGAWVRSAGQSSRPGTAVAKPQHRRNFAFLVNTVATRGDNSTGFNHSGKPGVTKFCALSYLQTVLRNAPMRVRPGTALMKRFIAGCFALGALVAAQCAFA